MMVRLLHVTLERILDLPCHSLWQLRFINDSWLSSGLQDSPGLIHAIQVRGSADILARILRIDPAEVHRDITEIEDWSKAVFYKIPNKS